jgi:hypothetical protein
MTRLVLIAALVASSFTFAAAPKKYQVTGPILEIRDEVIVVEKGKDKWEVKKGAAKVEGGELKVGAKVTIEYSMIADTITVKGDKK